MLSPTPYASGDDAFFDAEVLATIYGHVRTRLDREVGGFLIGRRSGGYGLVHVTGALEAREAREEAARLTFTHATWAHLHTALERDHRGDQVVGWYHSHPGFGVFLSKHDLFIHTHFFAHPAQVALVVDPVDETEGLFGWRDGQIVPLFERRLPPATSGEPSV